ncbi:MAG: ATP-binding protein [bacterium]|nr:ATP-binding protein [bacterium]
MHLILHNQLTELQRVARIVTELGQKERFPSELVHDINFVLEEIISNIILYGYEDSEPHQIELELQYNEQSLELKIQDDAQAFNPLDAPEPDIDAPLNERPIGGLGIYLTRSLMDELSYTRAQEKNVLTLKKYIYRHYQQYGASDLAGGS